jgi:hypothetical protein
MPRRQYQHAYRQEDEFEDGPDLVTCGIYFLGFILIGAVIAYLVLKLGGYA